LRIQMPVPKGTNSVQVHLVAQVTGEGSATICARARANLPDCCGTVINIRKVLTGRF
jgi:hypothetical protein